MTEEQANYSFIVQRIITGAGVPFGEPVVTVVRGPDREEARNIGAQRLGVSASEVIVTDMDEMAEQADVQPSTEAGKLLNNGKPMEIA